MTFPCYFQSKPSKHLLGLSCPRHHCMSHSVLQGLHFPQVGHRGLFIFLLRMASGLCAETLQDMWIVALKLATQARRSADLRAHSTSALPRATLLPTDTDVAYPNFCWPQEQGNQIRSTSDFLCLHSTSMQRSKMTFGFLQRAADNLARLNDSLVSLLAQSNHLCLAGQGPVCAGMMLLERLSVALSSSSSLTAFSSHQLMF